MINSRDSMLERASNGFQSNTDVAALYCRLSKEDLDKLNEGDYSESIQNQKAILLAYAEEKGFAVYEVYADDDLSGMYDDRPAFKQMIRDAQKGKFNVIICKHQSRFTRDLETVEKYIHKYFVEWGIRFISITDNIDTDVKGNKKARQINGLMNEWYVEDLSDNIRTVFRRKMLDGQYLGSFACYGYKKDPLDRHKLVIDEPAAENVRLIYELYMNGFGTQKIARHLSERGILTPTQYKQKSDPNFKNPNANHDGFWSVSTLRRILTNEAYIGTLVQGREKKVSYKSRKVVVTPKSNWIMVKNNHPAIIDEQVFLHVQKLVSERRKTRNIPEHSPDNSNTHILAGKIHCMECGGLMVRNGKSKDYISYYLTCTVAKKSASKLCTPHYIRQDVVEEYVENSIRTLISEALSSKNSFDYIAAKLSNEGLVAEKSKLSKKIAELDAKIKNAKVLIAKTYAEKISGAISEEDFSTYKGVFDEELSALQKQKDMITNDLQLMEQKLASMNNIADLLERHRNFSYLTGGIINDFIDVIRIGERNPKTNEQAMEIVWKL